MEEGLNKNQKISRRGGARPGAGRPKGSKNLLTKELKELLSEVITEEDVQELFQEWYNSGEHKKQLAVIEYIYGKPQQNVSMGGNLNVDFANLMKKLHIEGKDTKGQEDNKEPVSE